MGKSPAALEWLKAFPGMRRPHGPLASLNTAERLCRPTALSGLPAQVLALPTSCCTMFCGAAAAELYAEMFIVT